MARGADMVRGTHAHATRHARPHGRAARAHTKLRWRHVARTRGRGHASPRGRLHGTMWQEGAGKWRAHGLVGPGNNIGAVMQ